MDPWTNDEVNTFFWLYRPRKKVQRDPDGTVTNVPVFTDVPKQMLLLGYEGNVKQCRKKLKKLKCDYRIIIIKKKKQLLGLRVIFIHCLAQSTVFQTRYTESSLTLFMVKIHQQTEQQNWICM